MRGARNAHFLGDSFTRIIPADAGSTSEEELKRIKPTDHPRGCGEH